MNDGDRRIRENKEPLVLIGSQMNFEERSKQTFEPVCEKKCRPQSAILSRRSHAEQKPTLIRPRSAGNDRLNFHWLPSLSEDNLDGESSASQYTDSSSRLLHNLLRTTTYPNDVSSVKNLNQESAQLEVEVPPQKFLTSGTILQDREFDRRELIGRSCQDLRKFLEKEANKKNLQRLSIRSCPSEMVEEKTVRFLDRQHCSQHHCRKHERSFVGHCCHPRQGMRFSWEDEFEGRDLLSLSPEIPYEKVSYPETRRENQRDVKRLVYEKGSNAGVGEVDDSVHQVAKEGTEAHQKWFNMNRTVQSSDKTVDGDYQTSRQLEDSSKLNLCIEKSEKVSECAIEVKAIPPKSDQIAAETVKDDHIITDDSTYEEIVQLIQKLDEEDSDSLDVESKNDLARGISPPMEPSDGKIDRLNEVYSYLEEVEKDSELAEETTDKALRISTNTYSTPRLDELLNKNSVELAHEVLSLKIQIEDQKQGIKLLRETLAEVKESSKNAELAHEEALRKANAEAEALIQRHQKFIKQLLNEKKNLNETVSKLVEDLKSGEERHKKNMKAAEERHLVEIKRVKDAQAVAEKLRREKWVETKTKKIKEMTVKGLEPELSRMAAHQQQELVELRNLHRAELEAVELRAARRTSELMDQLRTELTKEKENAIDRETAALRVKMEQQFEEERNKLQNHIQRLKDQIRREEERRGEQELEFQQKLLESRKEAEKERQKMVEEFQEKLEETRRRHLVELKNQKESLEGEKEIWMNNYKKQQSVKFLEREAEIRQEYKRERDKEIEVIIETLENESAQARKELNDAAENKLKRLREKMEGEIKEIEASEALLKTKLSEVKGQLLKKEDVVVELNSQVRQLQTEITFLRKSCEEMTAERANLREIMRKEFEVTLMEAAEEKEALEKEMSALKDAHLKELAKKDQINVQTKNEMQRELARVYTRIKTAVNKKEKIIESLREENRAAAQKCQQLELMLDRQRRNLLLQ